jgi:hypothetical protein
MNDLARRLEAIRRKQPRVTSEEFWRQVEEFRGTTSLSEEPPRQAHSTRKTA